MAAVPCSIAAARPAEFVQQRLEFVELRRLLGFFVDQAGGVAGHACLLQRRQQRLEIDRRGCRGAPDWVVEVLSPATAAHDQTLKLSAYERAGVPECWFVHPTDCIVTVYRLTDCRYGRPSISELTGTLACQSVDIVTVDWDRRPRPPGGADT